MTGRCCAILTTGRRCGALAQARDAYRDGLVCAAHRTDLSRDQLTAALREAAANPFALGSALAAYRRQQPAPTTDLATLLGLPRQALPRLAFARRPQPGPQFEADVRHVAARAGCSAAALRDLLLAVALLPPPPVPASTTSTAPSPG